MGIGQLITNRRNFLIRASAVTAAGASVTVPIITMDDARKRADHHLEGLKKAVQDLYPVNEFVCNARFPEGEPEALPQVMSDRVLVTIRTRKYPPPAPEYRRVFKSWRDYDRVRAGEPFDESMVKTVNVNEGY